MCFIKKISLNSKDLHLVNSPDKNNNSWNLKYSPSGDPKPLWYRCSIYVMLCFVF